MDRVGRNWTRDRTPFRFTGSSRDKDQPVKVRGKSMLKGKEEEEEEDESST